MASMGATVVGETQVDPMEVGVKALTVSGQCIVVDSKVDGSLSRLSQCVCYLASP